MLASGSASAQTVSAAPTTASITIYRDVRMSTDDLAALDPSQGLALITEVRTVDVPAGLSSIAFQGVADTMVAETAALEGLPGVTVERNETFNLLSPGSLVAGSVGRTVRVVQTGPKRGPVVERKAVIRSGPDGVVLDFEGRVEALGCGGPPTRLVFDKVPSGLGDKPTFTVLANLPKAGRYTVKLSYLATGFSWSADYVARIRPDGRTLDLSGWLTLSNKSAAGFAQAPTQVVAGELERDPSTRPLLVSPLPLASACWGQRLRTSQVFGLPTVEHRIEEPAAMSEMVVTAQKRRAVLSELGDYKLYTLPEPTTVAARQTKQVAFLEQAAVPFERVYVYRMNPFAPPDPQGGGEAPEVVLRLKNKTEFGLGKPLPSGTVSVMEPGGGGLVLSGQQQVRDTPVGLPLELDIGRAMDIAIAPRVEADHRQGGVFTKSVVVSFVNEKPAPVVVEFHEPQLGEDFKVVSASLTSIPSAGDEVWTIALKSGERAQLSYTMSYRN